MADPKLLLLRETPVQVVTTPAEVTQPQTTGAATLQYTEMQHKVAKHQPYAACFPQPKVGHPHVRHTRATASARPLAGWVFATLIKDPPGERKLCKRKRQATMWAARYGEPKPPELDRNTTTLANSYVHTAYRSPG